jgi:hypothetical protein
MPLFLLAIGLGVWYLHRKRERRMTQAHEAVAAKALASTNPAAIARVADVFAGEGFDEVANQLRVRAALPRRTAAQKAADRTAFSRGLQDPRYSRKIGEVFARRGMTQSARFLDLFGRGAERAMRVPPYLMPVEVEDPTDPTTPMPPEVTTSEMPDLTPDQDPNSIPLGEIAIDYDPVGDAEAGMGDQ